MRRKVLCKVNSQAELHPSNANTTHSSGESRRICVCLPTHCSKAEHSFTHATSCQSSLAILKLCHLKTLKVITRASYNFC